MFYWFLKDYESNVFKANDRKFSALYQWEKALIILLIVLVIIWAIIILFLPNSIMSFIFSGIILLLTIIIQLLENNRQQKEIDRIVERFKTNKLKPFLILLQDEKYSMFGKSLDSKDGVEWLLKSCDIEIEKCKSKPSIFLNLKGLFLTLVLPILTYIGVTFTSTLPSSEKLIFSVSILVVLLMISGLFFITLPVINDFLTKRIRIIEDLKDNLEYYKMVKGN